MQYEKIIGIINFLGELEGGSNDIVISNIEISKEDPEEDICVIVTTKDLNSGVGLSDRINFLYNSGCVPFEDFKYERSKNPKVISIYKAAK